MAAPGKIEDVLHDILGYTIGSSTGATLDLAAAGAATGSTTSTTTPAAATGGAIDAGLRPDTVRASGPPWLIADPRKEQYHTGGGWTPPFQYGALTFWRWMSDDWASNTEWVTVWVGKRGSSSTPTQNSLTPAEDTSNPLMDVRKAWMAVETNIPQLAGLGTPFDPETLRGIGQALDGIGAWSATVFANLGDDIARIDTKADNFSGSAAQAYRARVLAAQAGVQGVREQSTPWIDPINKAYLSAVAFVEQLHKDNDYWSGKAGDPRGIIPGPPGVWSDPWKLVGEMFNGSVVFDRPTTETENWNHSGGLWDRGWIRGGRGQMADLQWREMYIRFPDWVGIQGEYAVLREPTWPDVDNKLRAQWANHVQEAFRPSVTKAQEMITAFAAAQAAVKLGRMPPPPPPRPAPETALAGGNEELNEYLEKLNEELNKSFEGINKNFDEINKGFEGANKNFEGVNDFGNGINANLNELGKGLNNIGGGINGLGGGLNQLGEGINNIGGGINNLGGGLNQLGGGLNQLGDGIGGGLNQLGEGINNIGGGLGDLGNGLGGTGATGYELVDYVPGAETGLGAGAAGLAGLGGLGSGGTGLTGAARREAGTLLGSLQALGRAGVLADTPLTAEQSAALRAAGLGTDAATLGELSPDQLNVLSDAGLLDSVPLSPAGQQALADAGLLSSPASTLSGVGGLDNLGDLSPAQLARLDASGALDDIPVSPAQLDQLRDSGLLSSGQGVGSLGDLSPAQLNALSDAGLLDSVPVTPAQLADLGQAGLLTSGQAGLPDALSSLGAQSGAASGLTMPDISTPSSAFPTQIDGVQVASPLTTGSGVTIGDISEPMVRTLSGDLLGGVGTSGVNLGGAQLTSLGTGSTLGTAASPLAAGAAGGALESASALSAGGLGSAATPAVAGSTAGGGGGMPFMPMGGMGGGAAGGSSSRDRQRSTWLTEDEEVWGTDPDCAPAVVGRDDTSAEAGTERSTGVVQPAAPGRDRVRRGR
ncbi:hypothetical protein ACG83_01000 [Frankia sp. R43]|uniref:hypothetical protein n=1 Tax=Frankia sp. R43 TaxID=269536 RepID=UPI0006CA14F8|nr:hypothetical protein [Frankia sp. R43]KPM56538.1 hypothetical protein ACG83_01000 [Frankia sp. R43]